MRVYLTGFMGSGKSTVGPRLAAALEWPFLDLDELIEAEAGLPIREIFARSGEATFRQLEQRALEGTLHHPDLVVATGGGTFTVERNRTLAADGGVTVWLNPSFATIVRRIGALGKHDRPLFRDEVQAFSLYRSRLDIYRRADHSVDIQDDETPEEVAARVLLWLRDQCGI